MAETRLEKYKKYRQSLNEFKSINNEAESVRYRDNNIYVLALDLTTNLRKYQRREYYRFSCALEMNSRELLKEEIDSLNHSHTSLQPELPLKRSVIVDISGGGLRFVSNLEYEKGSIILCN